jgi:hypothetical protein
MNYCVHGRNTHMYNNMQINLLSYLRHHHAHDEVGGLRALEAVVGELAAEPVHLGALLRRAEVGVELPHRPPDEAVRRPQPRAAALRHLQTPHLNSSCLTARQASLAQWYAYYLLAVRGATNTRWVGGQYIEERRGRRRESDLQRLRAIYCDELGAT